MTLSASALRSGLDVRVYGTIVGRLARDPHGDVHFTVDRNWLEAGQRPPLGLAFLTDPGPRVQRGSVPVWFENVLPESDSVVRSWICKQHGISPRDSARLLQVLGRDLPGAVELTGDVEEMDDASAGEVPYDKLRFSLAGVQLKLSMLLDGDRFSLPARGQTGRWIIKIPGTQIPELSEVEAATMAWASASGLPTPRNHVLPIESIHGVDPDLLGEPRRAFAIERFDRRADGRVHQEDFAQALEIRPVHKYGESTRAPTYDSLARLVRDACGVSGQEDFIRRVAFVVASGNGDAHLKNWSFQWGQDHRPWLSPCYDQVATIAWPQFHRRLALSFGKSRLFAELDRERLRWFAERAQAPDGQGLFLQALEQSRHAWPSVVDHAPMRLREAMAEHWQNVPLLRALGGLPRA